MYEVVVTSHSLHVRKEPKYQSGVVTWIQNGQKFTASKVQNGWYYIDAKKGWSNGSYLKVTEKPKPAPPPPPKPSPPPKEEIEEDGDHLFVHEEILKTYPKSIKIDPTMSSSNNMLDLGPHQGSSQKTLNSSLLNKMNGTPNNPPKTGVPSSGTPSAKRTILTPDSGVAPVLSVAETIKAMGPTMANSFGSKKFVEPEGNFSYYMNPDKEITNASYNINVVKHNMNIWDVGTPSQLFSRFNRFKVPIVDNVLTKIVPYVFFTRPSLNVIDTATRSLKSQFRDDPLYNHLMETNPNILHSLGETLSTQHKFNPFLSNTARSFEPQDEIIRTVQTGDTYTGWKVIYGKNTNESNTAGQFNIQYQDNKEADIYRMHKAWITYINNVYRGIWNVRRVTLEKKILNYGSSVYYIICGADGETILNWSKYYGVFPINTPMSSYSWSAGNSPGSVDFVINYVYAMKEDYNPITIAEFNAMSSDPLNYKPIYDRNLGTTTPSMSGTPFIDQTTVNGKRVFKLRFRP